MTRPRILTGDQPTGRLHLGHWVGSLENRVRLQTDHDCYFLIANVHALTTRVDRTDEIRRDTIEIARDWIAPSAETGARWPPWPGNWARARAIFLSRDEIPSRMRDVG